MFCYFSLAFSLFSFLDCLIEFIHTNLMWADLSSNICPRLRLILSPPPNLFSKYQAKWHFSISIYQMHCCFLRPYWFSPEVTFAVCSAESLHQSPDWSFAFELNLMSSSRAASRPAGAPPAWIPTRPLVIRLSHLNQYYCLQTPEQPTGANYTTMQNTDLVRMKQFILRVLE